MCQKQRSTCTWVASPHAHAVGPGGLPCAQIVPTIYKTRSLGEVTVYRYTVMSAEHEDTERYPSAKFTFQVQVLLRFAAPCANNRPGACPPAPPALSASVARGQALAGACVKNLVLLAPGRSRRWRS